MHADFHVIGKHSSVFARQTVMENTTNTVDKQQIHKRGTQNDAKKEFD